MEALQKFFGRRNLYSKWKQGIDVFQLRETVESEIAKKKKAYLEKRKQI